MRQSSFWTAVGTAAAMIAVVAVTLVSAAAVAAPARLPMDARAFVEATAKAHTDAALAVAVGGEDMSPDGRAWHRDLAEGCTFEHEGKSWVVTEVENKKLKALPVPTPTKPTKAKPFSTQQMKGVMFECPQRGDGTSSVSGGGGGDIQIMNVGGSKKRKGKSTKPQPTDTFSVCTRSTPTHKCLSKVFKNYHNCELQQNIPSSDIKLKFFTPLHLRLTCSDRLLRDLLLVPGMTTVCPYAVLPSKHEHELMGLLEGDQLPEDQLNLLLKPTYKRYTQEYHIFELMLLDAKQYVIQSLAQESIAMQLVDRWAQFDGLIVQATDAETKYAELFHKAKREPSKIGAILKQNLVGGTKDHVIAQAFYSNCWTPVASAVTHVARLHSLQHRELRALVKPTKTQFNVVFYTFKCTDLRRCQGLVDDKSEEERDVTTHTLFALPTSPKLQSVVNMGVFSPEYHADRNGVVSNVFTQILSFLTDTKGRGQLTYPLAVELFESSLALFMQTSIDYLTLWRARKNWVKAGGSDTAEAVALAAAFEFLLQHPNMMTQIAHFFIADLMKGPEGGNIQGLPQRPPPQRPLPQRPMPRGTQYDDGLPPGNRVPTPRPQQTVPVPPRGTTITARPGLQRRQSTSSLQPGKH